MKKIMAIVIAVLLTYTYASAADGQAQTANGDFFRLFDDHGAIMMMLDPATGDIIYVNSAAALFYGYSKEQLTSMNIAQINTLTPEEMKTQIQAAEEKSKNFFQFEHRLASGEIRNVEVYSYPTDCNGKPVLFSVIRDVTEDVLLEQHYRSMVNTALIGGSIVIVSLLLLVWLLLFNRKSLKSAMQRAETLENLRKTFMDYIDSPIYLKDKNLKYVFVNRAMENLYRKKEEEIVGKEDASFLDAEFNSEVYEDDKEVLEKRASVIRETEWKKRIYKAVKFPVALPDGQLGVGTYISDITPEREREKKQEKTLYRHKILADIMTHGFESRRDQLDYALHEALTLTESQYGYIYLYNDQTRQLTLNSWTSGVMDACAVVERFTTYQLDCTGIWGEVVRQRRPIVVNDFDAPNPLKKGYPEGHVRLKKYMSVPVIIDGKIVAVVGLANKQSDYDDNDIYEMTLLMSGTWNAVERRQAQEKLTYERNKYLQTLISIGDGVMVVGQDGKVEMLNYVAEKLTGWSIEDARGKHYREIFALTHEQKNVALDDPIAKVFATDEIQEMENHAVLISKSGEKYFLEDSAAPIRDDAHATVGVVLVFRDVTEKKKQRKEIEYLSFHDSLTGLYNRRFFEEELRRLDTERNLPISIIMGDVNGLKLTNDIFGHACGDLLLIKLAEVLKKVCRTDDIIARWGGDEFVILLPRTGLEKAEQMVARIRTGFSRERIKAIRGSVSMGAGVKQVSTDHILDSLSRAEEKMYAMKSLEQDKVRNGAIDAIIRTFHKNYEAEKRHSETVGALCEEMGKLLALSEADIKRLRRVGIFHDIGKSALDPKLVNQNSGLTAAERIEYQKHPVIGCRILNSFDDMIDLSKIVLAHHERWDGSGYPQGLKGEEIPLLARILSVADTYERRLHNTDNPEQIDHLAAVQVIRDGAGSQFDPEISELFIRLVGSKGN